MPLTPNNREEHWLQGMVDGSTTLEPNKRREYWYKEIVDAIGSGGGGGGGAFVVNGVVGEGQISLDKTWNEINSANTQGYIVIAQVSVASMVFTLYLVSTNNEEGFYECVFLTNVGNSPFLPFETDNENGYPVAQMN